MRRRASFAISIASILIEVESERGPEELGIAPRFGPFLCAPAEGPAVTLRLRWEPVPRPPEPEGPVTYDPGSIWRLHRHHAGVDVVIAYPAMPHSLLRMDGGWSEGVLYERPGGPGWQSVLRTGATELLVRVGILRAGGLVLHAAGLDDGGCGIVLVGHAGAGKSTQAALWGREPGVIALSDDRIAIRSVADSAWCYGTPWGGTADIARNRSARLRALVLLEQAPANELQRIEGHEAAPLLLARAFLPYWDSALMEWAADNLGAILSRIPVFRLRCRPEPDVIPLLRAAIA